MRVAGSHTSVVVDPPILCALRTAADHLALDVTEVELAAVVAGVSLTVSLVGHCSEGFGRLMKECRSYRCVSRFARCGILGLKLTLIWENLIECCECNLVESMVSVVDVVQKLIVVDCRRTLEDHLLWLGCKLLGFELWVYLIWNCCSCVGGWNCFRLRVWKEITGLVEQVPIYTVLR